MKLRKKPEFIISSVVETNNYSEEYLEKYVETLRDTAEELLEEAGMVETAIARGECLDTA